MLVVQALVLALWETESASGDYSWGRREEGKVVGEGEVENSSWGGVTNLSTTSQQGQGDNLCNLQAFGVSRLNHISF